MKKLFALIISWSLAFWSLLLPSTSPAYALAVADQVKCMNPDAKWNKKLSKAYAKLLVTEQYKWNLSEYRALLKLWGKESAWDHTADNPESTAYGIAQVLKTKPGTPAPLQIERGLAYIQHRYDKPSIAWAHWRAKKWY
jgi:peptidoglycan DL-endopeptidase CwlO